MVFFEEDNILVQIPIFSLTIIIWVFQLFFCFCGLPVHIIRAKRDRIPYLSDCNCGTPTMGFLTVKNILNSFISTLRAKFMTMVVNNFLFQHFHEKIKISSVACEPHTGQCCQTLPASAGVEIRKGMYGWWLTVHGYYLSHITSWLWLYKQWNKQLCLEVTSLLDKKIIQQVTGTLLY